MLTNWRFRCCVCDVYRSSNHLRIALAVVFLFLFTLADAQQGQWEEPENTVSVVGSNVTLKCVSPSRNCRQIEWQKYVPDANAMIVFKESMGIYAAFRDRYSVDNASGCNLVIDNVNLTDAGRFICRTFIDSQQTEKAASLIILKDHPKCTTNASDNDTAVGDGVQLTCEVTYNSTTRALMVWNGVTNAPDAVDNRSNIHRSYSVVASAPVVPSFTCVTSFAVDTGVSGIATNIPVTTCSTADINVLYSVRDVTLSPSSTYYTPGTTIKCMAKGQPSPSFKWQEKGNNGTWTDVQSESGTGFTRSEASDNRYRCHATNIVRGISHNATSQEFQFNHTSSDASTTPANTTPISLPLTAVIGVGVGVVILLLIIVIVVCFCAECCPGYKCCHSEKSKEKIRDEQPLTENPDIYSNIDEAHQGPPKAKPRSTPKSEPPKRPQGAPPQAMPRTDNPRAGKTNDFQHEEVTYAELAKDAGPRQIPKNNHIPQETIYAAVGTA